MRQFDVFANPNRDGRKHAPCVVVLQSHHLNLLQTLLLAPLVNDAEKIVSSVDVAIEFNGNQLVLVIAEMAGVSRSGVGRVLGNVREHEDAIRRAIDRVFCGF